MSTIVQDLTVIEVDGSLVEAGLLRKAEPDVKEDDTKGKQVQRITLSIGRPTVTGTFKLTHDGQTTTSSLAHNASASDVKKALESLSKIKTVNVEGKGTEVSPWKITFVKLTDGTENYKAITVTSADTLSTTAVSTVTEKTADNKTVQVLSHDGTQGKFTLTYKGETTAALDLKATDVLVRAALKALTNITDVTVSKVNPDDTKWEVTFVNPNTNLELLTINDKGLLAGGGAVDIERVQKGINPDAVPAQAPVYSVGVAAESGNVGLRFGGGQVTDELFAAIATSGNVADALNGLTDLPNFPTGINVTVTGAGTQGNPWLVTFTGQTAGVDVPQIEFAEGDRQLRVGGDTLGTVTIDTVTQGEVGVNEVQSIYHDAVFGTFKLKFDRHVIQFSTDASKNDIKTQLLALEDAQGRKIVVSDLLEVEGAGTPTDPWRIQIADSDYQFPELALDDVKTDLTPITVAKGLVTGIQGGIDLGKISLTRVIGGSEKDQFFASADSAVGITFEPGKGDDLVEGGKGADTLRGDAGQDFIKGGEGKDTLEGGDSRDRLEGGDGDDVLKGGDDTATDLLFGDKGKDTLEGGGGDDRLSGGDDADELSGGKGEDTLLGGTGADILKGGKDDDTYAFKNGFGRDRVIEEVGGGEKDTLNFSQVTDSFAHILSGGRLISGTLDGGVVLDDLLEVRQAELNGFTHSSGEVFFNLMGFAPD